MDPVGRPLEPVDAAAGLRHASVELFVTSAWADHHAEVYAFLVRTTRDPGVAEDLVQEAFLRLTREVSSGREPTNVRAWLYRVAPTSPPAGVGASRRPCAAWFASARPRRPQTRPTCRRRAISVERAEPSS
jgi:predicted RNA polymerase sigma factor